MHLLRYLPAVGVSLVLGSMGLAAPHSASVPLREGKFHTADLVKAMEEDLHLPRVSLPDAVVDVNGLTGNLFIQGVNQSLGQGCSVVVQADALVVTVDPEKLPKDGDAMGKATRVFTATVTPEATANQQSHFGLFLPKHVDQTMPIVVLVHGLDSNDCNWTPLKTLLENQGYQVGYFAYPSDQPIADSATFFGENLQALRGEYPKATVDIVAHSMGSLVARAYVESDAYHENVSHFIMIAPPNEGSNWAKLRFPLELHEHWRLMRTEKDWSPSWMITDGLGEAARDLKPHSEFLKALDARPRAAGVAYTIIAGDRSAVWETMGSVVAKPADWTPDSVKNVWGIRQAVHGLEKAGEKLSNHQTNADGPVKLKSTRLAGVDDFVVLHADHASLYYSCTDQAPAAWDTIRDRLGR